VRISFEQVDGFHECRRVSLNGAEFRVCRVGQVDRLRWTATQVLGFMGALIALHDAADNHAGEVTLYLSQPPVTTLYLGVLCGKLPP